MRFTPPGSVCAKTSEANKIFVKSFSRSGVGTRAGFFVHVRFGHFKQKYVHDRFGNLLGSMNISDVFHLATGFATWVVHPKKEVYIFDRLF